MFPGLRGRKGTWREGMGVVTGGHTGDPCGDGSVLCFDFIVGYVNLHVE